MIKPLSCFVNSKDNTRSRAGVHRVKLKLSCTVLFFRCGNERRSTGSNLKTILWFWLILNYSISIKNRNIQFRKAVVLHIMETYDQVQVPWKDASIAFHGAWWSVDYAHPPWYKWIAVPVKNISGKFLDSVFAFCWKQKTEGKRVLAILLCRLQIFQGNQTPP